MMFRRELKYIIILVAVVVLGACASNKQPVASNPNIQDEAISNDVDTCDCGAYNKLFKSTNYNLKYACALKYYKNKKYDKALGLFEELVPFLKGDTRGELAAFLFAFSNFHAEDYESASFYFMIFSKSYPFSARSENAAYMVAYCAYLSSPDIPLDPSNTYRAIMELQLFVDRFPTSARVQQCNTLIDKLRLKLETKDFRMAKQYFKMRQYKAAIASFNGVISTYPDTEYREECLYLIIKSAYLYAIDSIDSKKYERYKMAADNYITFKTRFAQSKFLDELAGIYEDSKVQMDKYKPFKV
ncbi:MAG: outer membrane protein assembly factor BamD [Sphingobacteriales bacterium JAD_PAG50586_3]|nr:MAG: outer membrane protein assembly factor BamD [Sphingobacteriales bacterium JAD_PAG50586_3]